MRRHDTLSIIKAHLFLYHKTYTHTRKYTSSGGGELRMNFDPPGMYGTNDVCRRNVFASNIPKEKTMASIVLRVLSLTAVGIGVTQLRELSLGLRNQTGCATVVV